MGGESGVGTWGRGHGRGLGTRGIGAPCAGKGAPCEGCWGLDGPYCPSLGVPTASPGVLVASPGVPAASPGVLVASHAAPVAYAAARVASGGRQGGRVEADDQKASDDQGAVGDQGVVGDLEAFDAHWASDVHQAYRVALEGYRSLEASEGYHVASPGPSASGPDPWKASHPSAFLQDHWDPSPSAEGNG